MKVEKLLEIIGSDFYTGVPDSQLKALCNSDSKLIYVDVSKNMYDGEYLKDEYVDETGRYLSKVGENFKKTEWHTEIETLGMSYVEQFQFDIMNEYFKSGAL